ncbi:MAG TPA: RNA 2',3'-cyclic phosphodiesterase [Verrucomicrobiota bacterium]|nr:RNA 2',3'-cyclic phosphodiesterase [Verrucomicrobiota bacterium]HQL79619.1 RNA 2',3'-cyclic phosphodiesterase [Verrucomicrobiota bacterium]
MTDIERVRLFIAVAIPEAVKAELEAAQAELRRALPDAKVRWARREQFHLTLKFLGDVEAARVEALGEAIHSACRGFAPLRLRLEGVGAFPNLRRARVLWTGVRSEAEQLGRLQAAVDFASRDFTSEEKEQEFTGHVTLARIQGMKRTEAEALAELVAGMKDRVFGQWTMCRIELMQSQLLPQGARHTLLAATALGEPPRELA